MLDRHTDHCRIVFYTTVYCQNKPGWPDTKCCHSSSAGAYHYFVGQYGIHAGVGGRFCAAVSNPIRPTDIKYIYRLWKNEHVQLHHAVYRGWRHLLRVWLRAVPIHRSYLLPVDRYCASHPARHIQHLVDEKPPARTIGSNLA